MLVLMGLRGSGKTTLAKAVAARVGGVCIELDALTVELLGVSTASEAFQRFGEEAFRTAESSALSRVLENVAESDVRAVLSLGGGTPFAPGAAELLRASSRQQVTHLTYLHAESSRLASRVRAAPDNGNRPALVGDSVEEESRLLYEARDPLYTSLAESTIDVTTLTVEESVAALLELWIGTSGSDG